MHETNRHFSSNNSMIRCLHIAAFLGASLALAPAAAADLACDLSQFKPADGLSAKIEGNTLALTWRGERDADLRLGLGIDNGHPIVAEMAVRPNGGAWSKLASNLSPEFNVTSGVRRISEQQLRPLRALGVDITPEIIEKEKWVVFWDSPLSVPGLEGTNPGLPRSADEIQRATSSFQTTGCSVKTDGARLEVSFPGLSLGIFEGRLQYTVYRGSNLVRQEAIAKTQNPSVAYKYSGGLKGLSHGRCAASRLARHLERLAKVRVRRFTQQRTRGLALAQPSCHCRSRGRLDRRFPAAAPSSSGPGRSR